MLCLLLVLLALRTGASIPKTVQDVVKVSASARGDVILPCTFNITARRVFPTVEWSKDGLEPNVIFLYRDGCEVHEMKNKAFEYRTSFVMKNLKNGDISLRISDVQLSDAGTYWCMTLWKNGRDRTAVELVVDAIPEPKLSVVSAASGGVTLQCEARCSLPEPEISFLDDQGKELPAEAPKRDQDISGCYSVTRRVTFQTATSSVTCRVHPVGSSPARDTQILIPANYMTSCDLSIGLAVGGTISVVLVFGLVVFLLKKYCKLAEVEKSPVTRQESDESMPTAASENLEQRAGAGNPDTSTVGQLAANPKPEPQEREDTIHQPQNNFVPQLSPVVCHHNQPTIICSPSASSPKDSYPVSIHNPETSTSTSDSSSTATVPGKSNPPRSALRRGTHPKPCIQRQSSISGPDIQRQSSIPGPDIQRQSSIPGPDIQRQSSIPGPDLQRQSSIPGPDIQRQNSISGPDIQRQSSISGPDLPHQKYRRTRSTSSSGNTAVKTESHICRSKSISHPHSGSDPLRLQRRASLVLSNRFGVLSEESEPLVSEQNRTQSGF